MTAPSVAEHNGQQRCYAASAAALLATGLGSPLPLPYGQKSPPPTGWTGETAPYASAADVARWVAERPDANIALRLAADVVGIDVDAYDGRPGVETLASFEAKYGPLPATWVSSARPAPSGIRWYVLPEGATSAGMGDLGPGVELIRAGHRYACVPPSLHPLGVPVAWREPDAGGTPSDTPPTKGELPVLTGRQVEGLAAHRTSSPRRTTPSPAPASPSSASPEVPEALRARVRDYARAAYAGLVEQAQALAALPEGERLPHAGELVGWESGLGKHLVLRALQLDAATWHGGAPGTFVAAVRGVSADPDWTLLVDEKAAAKARIAEPAPLPRFVTEHDPSDPFGGGYVTAAMPAPDQPASLTGRALTRDDVELQSTGRLSDAAVADDFARRIGARFRWAAAFGWLRWDGRRWTAVPEAVLIEESRRHAKRMAAEAIAKGLEGDVLRATLARLQASKMTSVVRLARGVDGVIADASAFDRHPDLLTVGNGVVDLRTGELRPFDPALLMTKATTVNYVPGARHPDWQTALQAIPAEVGDCLQVRFGQGVTGWPTPDDILPVLQGGGSNGKSALIGPIQAALGDHAVTVPERVLIARPSDHPTELMTLRGARLGLIEELPEDGTLSPKRLKDTLGTAKLSARYVHQNSVEWVATHTLVQTTNYRPRVKEVDDGTWRRLALVRFPYRFRRPGEPTRSAADRVGDPTLRERLRHGDDGRHEAVLAWLIEGARRWYSAGMIMPPLPPLVQRDTDDWRAATDRIMSYVGDRLAFDPAASVLTTEVFADFTSWQTANGMAHWSETLFVERFGSHNEVTSRDVTKARTTAVSTVSRPSDQLDNAALQGRVLRVWRGVRFRPAADRGEAVTCENASLDRGRPGHSKSSKNDPHIEEFRATRSTPVESVEMTALSCPCGTPISAQRHSYGKTLCVNCETAQSGPVEGWSA